LLLFKEMLVMSDWKAVTVFQIYSVES